MTLQLVLHTLRGRRVATLWFSVGMFTYALLIMAVWPAAGAMDFAAYIKGFPEPLQAMLLGGAFDNALIEENSFYQFVSVEYFSWVPMVVAFFGVWFGAGVIARDYDRGSLDLLLAQPLGRVRFVLARFAGVAVAALPVVAVSVLGLLIGATLWSPGVDMRVVDILLVHVHLLLFALATAGIGLLLAVLVLEPGRAYGTTAVVLVLMFFVKIITSFVDQVAWLGYASLFKYWQPVQQFMGGEFAWRDAVVMAGVALATLLLALAVFRRRDIAT